MKVKHLAKELKKPVKELIEFLTEFDVPVNSGSTKLSDDVVQNIRDVFKGEKSSLAGEDFTGQTVPYDNEAVVVKDFCERFNLPLSEVLKILLDKGLLFNLNSEIDPQLAAEIALNFEIILDISDANPSEEQTVREKLEKIEEQELDESLDDLESRPPVVAIMGHVDHGKTLLLDRIRESNVVEGEAGGITQHIGAYQVSVNDKKITFLDTPGHAAFTALRARGAQVTDVTILVVAANDGVKPQTIEAIHHAKAAQLPIIVAINKMDAPGADVDKVKQQLAEHEVLSEDWGGKVPMVPVSALKKEGLQDLLEMVQLTADLLELKATYKGHAKGVVIESHLSKQKGAVATILVKTGQLNVGDNFVLGMTSGKVRAMLDDHRQPVKQASPGTPVELTGISEVPSPGDILEVKGTEKACKALVEERQLEASTDNSAKVVSTVSLESLSEQIESGDVRKLNLIVKSDVNGSLEAIVQSIQDIESEDVSINIIHAATGPVNQNDIMLAKASGALVIAFSVDANPPAVQLAEKEGIEIKYYSVIYAILEDITKALKGLFKVEYEEVDLGYAEVRELFKFSKVGSIAGCAVKEGLIKHTGMARVYRGKEQIFDGKIHSLKRFKEDVKEVKAGFECGIVLEDFNDFEPDDHINCYEVREVER